MGDISDKLEYLNNTKDAIKQAIIDKGVTVQSTDTFRSYANKIGDIQTGIPPSFWDLRIGEYNWGVYNAPNNATYTGDIVFTGYNQFGGSYLLTNMLSSGTSNTTTPSCRKIDGIISFPDLVLANMGLFYYFCNNQNKLTGIDFPKLTTVNGQNSFKYAFQSCTSLTTVSFPLLETISGTDAFGYTFSNCTGLTSLSFPSLTSTDAVTSVGCMTNMLSSVTGCTVHFPSSLQSVISSASNVTAGFGGTNTTVLFDL